MSYPSMEPAEVDAEISRLFRTHYDPLTGYIRKEFGLSGDLAEDAVVHAFLVTRQNWTRVRQGRSPRGYLYKVAGHEALKLKKAGQRLLPLDEHETPEESATPHPLRAGIPRHYLDRLPPRQRQVVTLRIDGLPHAAIATQLDIAVGTVKAHIHAAKKALRAMYDQEER
ncbi:RNA polymerase sigma factor [Nocardia brasiliensis]|uniref:RNA polymerase sigma factor n=1 Tax=Nocardia brasiliensis TaxID=37326 RepID=UPI003D8AC5DE